MMKSKTTALILSILTGGLGIDRFYLGYTGMVFSNSLPPDALVSFTLSILSTSPQASFCPQMAALTRTIPAPRRSDRFIHPQMN